MRQCDEDHERREWGDIGQGRVFAYRTAPVRPSASLAFERLADCVVAGAGAKYPGGRETSRELLFAGWME